MNFYAYTSSGQIIMSGSCPEDMVGLQHVPNATVVLGTAQPGKDFHDEVLGVQAIPPQPNEHHVFSYTLKQWIDPRTLQDFKTAKWARIKALRDAAEEAGFVWDGATFDSDKTSQSRIQGAAQLATLAQMTGSPFSIDWTLADNTVRTLNAQEMIAVGMAIGQHINACHTRARQLRSLIEAAQTKEEVEAIYWE